VSVPKVTAPHVALSAVVWVIISFLLVITLLATMGFMVLAAGLSALRVRRPHA
jgi:membrane protein implicated in regulation of membrane protease activity